MVEAHGEYSPLFDSDMSACAHWDHLGSGKKYQHLVPSPTRTVWQRGKRPGPQDVNPWGGSDTPRESRGWLLSTPALAGLLLGVGIASEDTQSRRSPGPADTCQVFSMSLHSVNRLVWTVSSSLTVRDALSTTPTGVMSGAYGSAANCESG